MIGYVYILESPNCRRYYIGSTTNLVRRLDRHTKGMVVATRNKGPWRCLFSQTYKTATEARKQEYWLKRMKSRQLLGRIIQEGRVEHVIT